MSYQITLEKEYFHFSSAHFVIFNATDREPLHGHNYYIRLTLKGEDLKNGKLVDISIVKKKLRTLCKSLDHLTLIPLHSQFLTIKEQGESQCISYGKKNIFIFPKKDICLLPLDNTTMENLACYLLNELSSSIPTLKKLLSSMELTVKETNGQQGTFIKKWRTTSWYKKK